MFLVVSFPLCFSKTCSGSYRKFIIQFRNKKYCSGSYRKFIIQFRNNKYIKMNAPFSANPVAFLYYSKVATIAESICTQYSKLSGQLDNFLGSGTFKKLGTLLIAKSRVQKNRVIVIQKEKRPGCLFSFGIPMTLFTISDAGTGEGRLFTSITTGTLNIFHRPASLEKKYFSSLKKK